MADLASFTRFARSCEPGEMIFSEYEPGDSFYLIQSGRVRISKIVGDFEKTIDILQAPEIFGEMAILEGAPRSATAVAVDTVKVLEFNRANFEVLMMGNPQIALRLLKLFTKRIWDQKRRFMILTLEDPQAKVADVFLMLSETSALGAASDQEGEKREFKITIDDVAHWAGMSSAQVQTILGHFANQRRVELFPDRIVVRNISDFSRFVNSKRKKMSARAFEAPAPAKFSPNAPTRRGRGQGRWIHFLESHNPAIAGDSATLRSMGRTASDRVSPTSSTTMPASPSPESMTTTRGGMEGLISSS